MLQATGSQRAGHELNNNKAVGGNRIPHEPDCQELGKSHSDETSKWNCWDFPSSSVVMTAHFQFRGYRFDP